jgi:succinylglutamate desuccinylase
MNSKRTIIIKKAKKPGKTLAIFAGIHGNESVGVRAFDTLLPKLTIEAGTVYFVYGNPKAIKQGVQKQPKT